MKKYEIIFIVRPDLEAGKITETADSMLKVIKDKKAKSATMKALGQKDLAYEIKDYKTGYYFLIELEAENSSAIEEFDRLALINEDLIRHLIIKVEE